MKKIFLFVLLTILIGQINVQAQKRIKSKGDYVHAKTGVVFPLQIDDYQRKSLYSYDKMKDNVGGVYENNRKETTLSVYVYPAGGGYDGRIHDHYFELLQELANVYDGIDVQSAAVSFKDDGIVVNGFKSTFKSKGDSHSVALYECGKWWFKIRVSSSALDSIQICNLEGTVLNQFRPTDLVKQSPLSLYTDVHVAPGVLHDTLLLDCVLGGIFAKLKWANAEIDSLERIGAFPSAYLDIKIAEIEAFVNFADEHPDYGGGPETMHRIQQYKKIIESGYLKEYLMEQYYFLLRVPEGTKFNYEDYYLWKELNSIDLVIRDGVYFYIIECSE